MKRYALIVCYQPDISNLKKKCNAILSCNTSVILVDNSEQCYIQEFSSSSGIELVAINENVGIAKAQNIGINLAIQRGAEIIIFFDQDSTINGDFIANLLSPIKNSEAIVVAPVFFDEQQGFEYPSFRFNSFNLLRKIYSKNQIIPYQVDIIISSGSAATKEVFIKAGIMDEDFFIDFVDIEWSIRCRKNKIPIYIVPKAKMIHSIGEKSINVGIMRGFIHSAQRSYYKLRNPFLLLRKAHVPLILAIKEIIAAMIHQFVFILYVENKQTYFRNYILAIFDGIKGVKGKKR